MSHKNCRLCDVQRQGDGWGFNVMTEHRLPLVSLTYGTEALAKEALSLMAKVIEGAVVASHATPQRERRRAATSWRSLQTRLARSRCEPRHDAPSNNVTTLSTSSRSTAGGENER